MEIERIKKIIVDQKEDLLDFFQREKIIERDLDMKKIAGFLSHPNALVITGPRRSGKSTLAVSIFKEKKFGYLNFDDERLAGFTSEDFDTALQAFYELYGSELSIFVFDEIQNIYGWELFIGRLRRTKKIVITGSNARLLSGELATHLTGRYLDTVLYPFSFREFLKIKEVSLDSEDLYSAKRFSRIKILLDEYLKVGGFPEVFKFGSAMAGKIYEDIINRDILIRHKIKNQAAFKELSNYLLSGFGGEFSYSKLGKIFGIKNVHTTKNYVDYLSSSYLIVILEKFSYKLKEQYITSKKVYGIDTGLVNYQAFQFSGNLGKILENAVLLELLRRSAGNGSMKIYYWQDYQGREVDFVVKEGNKIIQLIQVCQTLENPGTSEREIKSLLKASDELRCDDLLIITRSSEGTEEIKGRKIKIVSAWKWLLNL